VGFGIGEKNIFVGCRHFSYYNRIMNLLDSHCHCHYLNYNWLEKQDFTQGPYTMKFLLNVSTQGDDGKQWVLNTCSPWKDKIYHYNNKIFLGYSVGFHPQEESVVDFDQLNGMAQGAMAIGEIGFDVGPNSPSMELQTINFHTQMKVAIAHNIPALIHCRDGWDIFFKETVNYKHHPMVIHCFTGSLEESKKLMEEYNCLISISGIITYNKADAIREAVQTIPINRLIIETDTPFLTPYQYRKEGNKENNPLLITEVLEKVAQLKSVDPEVLSKIIEENFKKLFKIENLY
jgi:TatD DNase family protein